MYIYNARQKMCQLFVLGSDSNFDPSSEKAYSSGKQAQAKKQRRANLRWSQTETDTIQCHVYFKAWFNADRNLGMFSNISILLISIFAPN